MVSAATEYRKNGFNDQDAAQLARVSSMFQNVADESISTGDAAQFLISQLIAFNQNTGDVAGNAMHIADALNEVANNFAVGTGDLATGLKVVASTSSAMGNSLEQTIGLMTAITEQTKNASKASRGLNSIMANLAQVLDDTSSNGKKITEIFEQLGVEMYENGQLKSGYDLLAGLSEKWDTLDNNSQKYIATTVAGTTQLNNFLALMNNFDHAVGATNKALESQGSAMRENDAYMESIQAKLSQLQSTFQDFANNVISSDLAKAVLDLANGLLQIANTDLGQIVTQIVLLTGLGWGATSLTKALGIFKVGIQQFKILGQVAGAAGAAGGITSVAHAFAALSLAGGAALPVILGVATVLAVGGALWKATEDSRKSFEELETEIGNVNDKLQSNKKRIDEINALPWYERTQAILNEKDALEKENDELQTQIDKLTVLSEKKAKQVLQGGYVTGEKIRVSGITGKYADRYNDSYLPYVALETYEQLAIYLDDYIPGASRKTKEELEELGVQFETVQSQVYKTGEAYEQELIKQADELTERLKTNHSLTDDELTQYNDVISKLDEVARAHESLGESSENARDALDGLTTSYESAVKYTEKYGEASTESSRKVTDLVSSLATAASQSDKTKAAYYQLVAAEKVFNNSNLNVSEKISTLQQLAQQAGITATLLAASSTATHDQMSGYIRTQMMKGMSESDATQSYLNSIYKEFMSFTPTAKKVSTGGGGSGKTTTKKNTILENYKERVNILKSELALMQERGDNEEAQVAKMRQIQDALHQQAEYMRKIGSNEADINALSQEHWKYTNQINNLLKEQKDTTQDITEELNKQKSAYESAVSYVISQIDEEISALEKQKSDIEKFYDDQIQALQDTNDELERQIQYEQLLNNLAQAKDKGLYVFSNGQFQYMQDVEAISAAQAELDAYDRDEALRKEVERLNKLKDRAVESIDKQIEKWQEYRDEWSNVVNQYGEEQNKLLAEQLFGINTEQQNWEKRLSNAQEFANKYNAIMASLDAASGTTTSGGGYSFSGTGTGGWSEAEMNEGFVSSGGSSKGSKKSVSQMRSEVNAALEKSKATGKKVSLGGGVSIDYSRVNKHAEGTLGTPGGLSLVGEQGPELRVLGQGDGVIPADITRNLWDWGKINPNNISGNTTHIFNIDNLTLPNVNDAKSLVAGLKNLAYQRAYKRA